MKVVFDMNIVDSSNILHILVSLTDDLRIAY